MLDELFDRTYQPGRADLHDGLDQLASRVSRTVMGAFRVGTSIQFNAPWSSRKRRDVGCA